MLLWDGLTTAEKVQLVCLCYIILSSLALPYAS